MMWLLKIEFDCNDGDEVYGLKLITDEEKEIIENNPGKMICLGAYIFGDTARRVDESLTIEYISDNDAEVLKRLGLDEFGEAHRLCIDEIPDLEDEDSEDEDEED